MQDIKFFLLLTNYSPAEIVQYKEIHTGYTNRNFLIKTNDQKQFILRIPIKKHDFINEWHAYCNYQKIKFIDFNLQNGVYVKKFLIANHPNLSDKKTLKNIIKELQIVHKKSINQTIKAQDWFEWISYNVLEPNVLRLFYQTADKIKDDIKTFTHHDLNAQNILVKNGKIFLIDWEWARIDSPYFDFATLALNDNVDQKLLIKYAHIDETKLNDYKFMILVFSHMWCNYMNTSETHRLKNKIFINIQKMMAKML